MPLYKYFVVANITFAVNLYDHTVSIFPLFIDMSGAGIENAFAARGPDKLGKQEEATACSEAFLYIWPT